MIIVLDRLIREDQKTALISFLEDKGFKVREIIGEEETILGAVGSISLDPRVIEVKPGVIRVIPITKAYKLASRELKKGDTIINSGGIRIGGPRISVIAGPCAVESREQIMEAALAVRDSGAIALRGGAYKPRTSPYSFQGLGEEGLKYLREAGDKYGLLVTTEIVSSETADMMTDYVDIFQIGARNMQNFELLKKVGSLGKPVVVKRGLSATIEEWLMAAEYLMAHGTEDVILCERGIRTFETYTRNTLDLSAIPVVKKLSHLPVIVDPSHATGLRGKVLPMALAAVAAGADGLMVEVHPHPDQALSDGPQSLYPEQFEKLMRDIEALCPVIGKDLELIPADRRSTIQLKTTALTKDASEITVSFQGEHGAFSEKALNRYFEGEKTTAKGCSGFRDVFRDVVTGTADYGIIPIENSLAGSIHENYDLLIQHPDIQIIGEKMLRVQHSLIGFPDTDIESITRVYSHPQGLAQCAKFLDRHENMEKVPYYDTAGSVAYVARDKDTTKAAIANADAAGYYGLSVLKEGIETNPNNYTRFFVIARSGQHAQPEEGTKASFIFSLPSKPGTLFECIRIFAEEKLNMTKMESRPIIGKPWKYMFYVDVEVPKGEISSLRKGIERLSSETEDFRTLGIYTQR
ncbi:MAG: 3-deoxy-7-phosphoheptulonate synthase [Spirochaetales bacterium]|nr:3-deoxy-7-phosphoheptulonate synthase [Spirochaetales bacterium]